jgi:hypothetical protein
MINKAEKWPKWDRTLSKVQLLDRVDDKNEIVHMHIKKFFPSFSSFAQAVNMSKRGTTTKAQHDLGRASCVRIANSPNPVVTSRERARHGRVQVMGQTRARFLRSLSQVFLIISLF